MAVSMEAGWSHGNRAKYLCRCSMGDDERDPFSPCRDWSCLHSERRLISPEDLLPAWRCQANTRKGPVEGLRPAKDIG